MVQKFGIGKISFFKEINTFIEKGRMCLIDQKCKKSEKNTK